jgi:hypothetical protein
MVVVEDIVSIISSFGEPVRAVDPDEPTRL